MLLKLFCFLKRVIYIKTCTACCRYIEPSHQRLRAMMSCTNRKTFHIERRCDVVWMDTIDSKTNDSRMFFWVTLARIPSHLPSLAFSVRDNRDYFVHADGYSPSRFLQIINGSGQSNGSCDIWVPASNFHGNSFHVPPWSYTKSIISPPNSDWIHLLKKWFFSI